jgi:hypothetical protein
MEPVVPVGKASGKEIRCAMNVLPRAKKLVQNKLKRKLCSISVFFSFEE